MNERISESDQAAGITPIDPPSVVQRLADDVGGTIQECALLPDGSGFATMSMPLPAGHWSTVKTEHYEPPPMNLRIGAGHISIVQQIPGEPFIARRFSRQEFADIIRAAGRYAYRSATMQGSEPDLDPDALLQNLVVAFLGYWTENGLSGDEWANPPSPQEPNK